MAKKPDLTHEAPHWKQGGVFVFGVDEAGRGCLAGPVCAAVACFNPVTEPPVPVRDSKQMTHKAREECFEPIREKSRAFGVGYGTTAEIDRWNILRANYLAVARAIEIALAVLGENRKEQFVFLTDGNHPLVSKTRFFAELSEYAAEFPRLRELHEKGFLEICIVKGDSKVFSIASASVLAKVSRDRHMLELHERFPVYEFAAHKGYSTARHVEILRKVGPCDEHRRSFAPVSESLGLS